MFWEYAVIEQQMPKSKLAQIVVSAFLDECWLC